MSKLSVVLIVASIVTFLTLPLRAAVPTSAEQEYVLKLYKGLHASPELSFQEEQTSAKLAREMTSLGFDVTTQVGGHGVVAVYKNGVGPTVLVRADMDALPVSERTGLSYASTVKAIEQTGQEVSVMHACGHDVHMAVWVGTARWLMSSKKSWSGTLVMIAQPAEERGAGARAMLEDGLYKRFPRPDFNLAFHVKADIPTGSISYISGWAMANVDSVDIKLHGIGGHGAYPHATKDPIVLASSIILNLQTLVAREVHPQDPAVVTVGSIHGGAKHNIIPEQVDLQLTVRSYSDEVRQKLLQGIERITMAQAESYGLPKDKMPEVGIRDEYTPAVWNDPELNARLVERLKAHLGETKVVEVTPQMGGEDFSRYGRVEPNIPSVMLGLGGVSVKDFDEFKTGKRSLPSLHSALFAPDPEPTLQTGVDAMTEAVMLLMPAN